MNKNDALTGTAERHDIVAFYLYQVENEKNIRLTREAIEGLVKDLDMDAGSLKKSIDALREMEAAGGSLTDEARRVYDEFKGMASEDILKTIKVK